MEVLRATFSNTRLPWLDDQRASGCAKRGTWKAHSASLVEREARGRQAKGPTHQPFREFRRSEESRPNDGWPELAHQRQTITAPATGYRMQAIAGMNACTVGGVRKKA